MPPLKEKTKMTWICVKDKLPELRKKVLVKSGNDYHVASRFITRHSDFMWNYSDCCGCNLADNEITHWMELPEYKE